MLKNISILSFLILFSISTSFSQCGCPGNSTEIGLANLNELYDRKESTGNNFFINILYKNTYADSYYYHDINTGKGPIDQISSNFMNMRISYKPTKKWVIEADLGYLLDKTQIESLSNEIFTSSGLSDLTIYGRYIFFKSLESNLEFSAGSGVKIPLTKGSEYIPQNIQPSTGAYAILVNLFIKKYFPSINSGIIIGNRSDVNFNNNWDYKYGNSYITSLVFLYNLNELFDFGAEFRNDIRGKDFDEGNKLDESGMFSLNISPLLRFKLDKFIISGFYNYPIYQFYSGSTIANKYSFGVSISLNTNLNL